MGAASQFAPPSGQAASQPGPHVQPIPGGQIIARVGSEVILAGDILPRINEALERMGNQVPDGELERARRVLLQRELAPFIKIKVLYLDARRKIPAENFPQVEEKLDAHFDQVFLPLMMKDTGASSRAELDEKLRKYGASLAEQKRQFMERTLASQWLRQQIQFDREISHDAMLAYYHEHLADYEFEAKARWEEIMVRFDRAPSKSAAYRTIAELGNRVFQGAPFADVAKAASQGVTAAKGGQWDWTTRGALVSRTLNQALFTLPVGQLSQIIESQEGFHIIRVIERRDAGRVPFEEAQVEIRTTLQKEDVQRQQEVYLARIRKQIPVWTIFDDEPAAQAAASTTLHGPQF